MDQRIIKYYRGELNKKERIELLQEAFSDSELKQQMMEYQNLQALVHLHQNNRDEGYGEKMYSVFKSDTKRRKSKTIMFRRLRYVVTIAACMLITFQITYIVMKQSVSTNPILSQILTVPAGQRAHIILPDGSKVWVNAGSEIKYPSVFGKERKVQLKGEAFFEVQKGKNPFIVCTQKANVKVFGTRFNVFSYPHEFFSVSLLQGSVRVYEADKEENGIMLKPGQQLVEGKDGFHVVDIEHDPLLWKEGFYAFNKQKFRDVLKRLGIYYDVDIQTRNPVLLDYEYTGKFRQNDGVMEVLRILQKIHSFKIERKEGTNKIILY